MSIKWWAITWVANCQFSYSNSIFIHYWLTFTMAYYISNEEEIEKRKIKFAKTQLRRNNKFRKQKYKPNVLMKTINDRQSILPFQVRYP